jgi:hypothetical protein
LLTSFHKFTCRRKLFEKPTEVVKGLGYAQILGNLIEPSFKSLYLLATTSQVENLSWSGLSLSSSQGITP